MGILWIILKTMYHFRVFIDDNDILLFYMIVYPMIYLIFLGSHIL